MDVRLLTPREAERLNKQSRAAYEQGVKALDHVDAAGAIQQFDQASQLDPEATEMHFIATRMAMLRGRMTFRDEAVKYYDTAEKALDRVAKQKDLSPLTQQRLDTTRKMVTEEKKKLEARDARRKAIGDAFRKLYAQETYTEEGATAGEGAAATGLRRTDSGRGSGGGGSSAMTRVARSSGGGERTATARSESSRSEGRQEGRRGGGEGGGRRGGRGRG